MRRRRFSREFKVEAVKLVKDRGVSVAQAARDPDGHENVLRKWVKEFGSDPVQAFCSSSVPMHCGLSRIASRRVEAATRGSRTLNRHSYQSRWRAVRVSWLT
jgi:transposase